MSFHPIHSLFSRFSNSIRQAFACRVLSFSFLIKCFNPFVFSFSAFALLSFGLPAFCWFTFAAAPQRIAPLPGKKQDIKPATPFGPPVPPVPTLPRRAALVGGLSANLQAPAAHVDIDAAAFVGTLPTLWRGTVYRTPAQEASQEPPNAGAQMAGNAREKKLAGLLKSSGATLARINPFAAPGVVMLDPDGTPIVHWESVDFQLKQMVERGEDVVFSLQSATAWPPTAANTLIGATLRRYAQAPSTPIVRWELACAADNAPTRYAAFARLARVLVPGVPIGLNISSGDVAEGIRHTAALCAQDKLPLNSVAWTLSDKAVAAEKSVRLVRRALSEFPSLKNTLLLPTLDSSLNSSNSLHSLTSGDVEEMMGEGLGVARLASLGARLMQVAPQESSNPLIGVLAEERMVVEAVEDSAGEFSRGTSSGNLSGLVTGNLSKKGQMLALLNRMAGTRLKAQSDTAGIGCLAVRVQKRILVLLWREPQADSTVAVHRSDSGCSLTIARLHRLPSEMAGKARILRFEPGDFSAGPVATDSATTPTLSKTSLPQNSLLPVAVADVLEDDHFLPDELELPTLLAPGSACLLEVIPVSPGQKVPNGTIKNRTNGITEKALEWTLETNSANLRGGDTLDLILSVHNLSLQPRKLEVVLTASLPDVLPQTITRASLGTIASKGSRAFHFALHTPVTSENTTLAVNVLANNESSLSLTIPVLPALEVSLDTPRADLEATTGNINTRARLVNLTHHPLKLRLRANGMQGTIVTLPPVRTPVLSVVALSPPTRAPGVYFITLRIENQDRLLSTLHPLCGVPFLCPSIATHPAIDGDLSKWAEGVPLGMGQAEQAHGKLWKGPTDLSAYAYTRWDAQYFYFACAVTDDIFFQPYSAAEMERGDSVEFAVASDALSGQNRNSGASILKDGAIDYVKFGMALLKDRKEGEGSVKPTLVRFPNGIGITKHAAPVSVKGARVAIRREGTRTFYEAAIPWTALQAGPPHLGATIRLSIVVNDNDGRGRGYMEWGGNLAEKPQPLLFPALRLIK